MHRLSLCDEYNANPISKAWRKLWKKCLKDYKN